VYKNERWKEGERERRLFPSQKEGGFVGEYAENLRPCGDDKRGTEKIKAWRAIPFR